MMKKTSFLFQLILFFLLLNHLAAQDSIPPKPDWDGITLAGIIGIDEANSHFLEDAPNLGDSLMIDRYYPLKTYPNLRPCSKEIHSTLSLWVKAQNLRVIEDVLLENKVNIAVWQPDYEGLFELSYNCTLDGSRARAWIKYYTKSGREIEIDTLKNLYDEYKIADLCSQIQKDIGCGLD